MGINFNQTHIFNFKERKSQKYILIIKGLTYLNNKKNYNIEPI